MRSISAANTAGIASGSNKHHFFWIEARDRETGAVQTVGMWTGRGAQNFTIDGEVRLYLGVGSLVRMPDITVAEGLVVQAHQFELSAMTSQFSQAVDVYDPRHAQITVHEGFAHPQTDVLFDNPERIYQGVLDTLDIPEDERSTAVMSVVSKIEFLTRTLSDKKSDAVQSLRLTSEGVADRFRKYASTSGLSGDYWGQLPPPTAD
jgi:hypothetical protein